MDSKLNDSMDPDVKWKDRHIHVTAYRTVRVRTETGAES